jgi:vanillate O-demethylase monooxygenase subunit
MSHLRRAWAAAAIRTVIEAAFSQQDEPMLEAELRRIGGAEFWSLELALPADVAGTARARRKLDALIAPEGTPA